MNTNNLSPYAFNYMRALEWFYYADGPGNQACVVLAKSFLSSLVLRYAPVIQSATLGWGAETEQAAKQVSDQAPTPALYKQNPCS